MMPRALPLYTRGTLINERTPWSFNHCRCSFASSGRSSMRESMTVSNSFIFSTSHEKVSGFIAVSLSACDSTAWAFHWYFLLSIASPWPNRMQKHRSAPENSPNTCKEEVMPPSIWLEVRFTNLVEMEVMSFSNSTLNLRASSASLRLVMSRETPKVPMTRSLLSRNGIFVVETHVTCPSCQVSFSSTPIIGRAVRMTFRSSS